MTAFQLHQGNAVSAQHMIAGNSRASSTTRIAPGCTPLLPHAITSSVLKACYDEYVIDVLRPATAPGCPPLPPALHPHCYIKVQQVPRAAQAEVEASEG
jgi:hypothetical protein